MYTKYILLTNYNMYTYINNYCREIQCLIVKEWVNVEHEVHAIFFCANSTNISKLEIVYD